MTTNKKTYSIRLPKTESARIAILGLMLGFSYEIAHSLTVIELENIAIGRGLLKKTKKVNG